MAPRGIHYPVGRRSQSYNCTSDGQLRQNLASEMIKGQKTDYTFFTSIKSIRNTEHNYLGHIYVKYLEPINLEKFLGAKVQRKLSQDNFEVTALQLTTHLMEQQ